MSTPTRRAGRAGLLVPVLLLAAGLTGCGVADEQVRPGVAARVDGSNIDAEEIDPTVTQTCAYLDQYGDTRFPRVTVRRLLIETLIRREASEKLLAELDTELPPTYPAALAEIQTRYADASVAQSDAMRAGDTASTYVSAAGQAIGSALLRKETGQEPGDANAVAVRGAQAVDEWLASHEVELNPTYGLRVEDGTFVDDDGLSVAASTRAAFAQGVAAIDLTGDQETLGDSLVQATDALPEDQVCGPAAG